MEKYKVIKVKELGLENLIGETLDGTSVSKVIDEIDKQGHVFVQFIYNGFAYDILIKEK